MNQKVEIGTQDWLEQADRTLAQLAKQAAAAQWWELSAAIATAIVVLHKISKA